MLNPSYRAKAYFEALGFSPSVLHGEPETAEPVPASPDPRPHAVVVQGWFRGCREVPA